MAGRAAHRKGVPRRPPCCLSCSCSLRGFKLRKSTCGKGNACLTCSLFVTDQTHQQTLERQQTETEQLITRTTAAFQQRHSRAMPDDNVWLAQRRAEQQALARLLEAMQSSPGRAVQGAGCGTAPGGPVPLAPGPARHRENTP
jgi:hypothetical protein